MKYLVISLLVLFMSCAKTTTINRSVTTSMRRMPQINKVDAGINMNKGDFLASFCATYAFSHPDHMYISDSGLVTKTNHLNETVTTLESRHTYSQESRASFSGEGSFAFHDLFALGLSLDGSVGKIANYAPFEAPTLSDNNFEGSIAFRFSKQFNKLSVVLKPELIVTHVYGDYLNIQIIDDGFESDTLIARERMNKYSLANRCSSVLRYEPLHFFAPFVAFQIKSQPFFREPKTLEQDLAMGFYGGFDFTVKRVHCAPYVTIPLKSATGDYSSPVSGGVQIAYLFRSKKQP